MQNRPKRKRWGSQPGYQADPVLVEARKTFIACPVVYARGAKRRGAKGEWGWRFPENTPRAPPIYGNERVEACSNPEFWIDAIRRTFPRMDTHGYRGSEDLMNAYWNAVMRKVCMGLPIRHADRCLYNLVKQNNIDGVWLILKTINANPRMQDGLILARAVKNNNIHMVELLLEADSSTLPFPNREEIVPRASHEIIDILIDDGRFFPLTPQGEKRKREMLEEEKRKRGMLERLKETVVAPFRARQPVVPLLKRPKTTHDIRFLYSGATPRSLAGAIMLYIKENYPNEACVILGFRGRALLMWECGEDHRCRFKVNNVNIDRDMQACKTSGVRFIAFGLGMRSTGGGHHNVILVDIDQKTVERFEPNGAGVKGTRQKFQYGLLDKELTDFSQNYFPGFEYVSMDMCPRIGPQARQAWEKIDPEDKDTILNFLPWRAFKGERKRGKPRVRGFCQMWSMWYVLLRIENPDMDRMQLIDRAVQRIRENFKYMTDYIISFAHFFERYYRKQSSVEFELEPDFDPLAEYDAQTPQPLPETYLQKLGLR